MFNAGAKYYEEGQYGAAIAAFKEAYRLTKRPGLLFSIAQAFRRCYEKDQTPESLHEAIRYYARYLDTKPRGERHAEAASWLKKLKRLPDAKGWQAVQDGRERTQLIVAVNVNSAKLVLDGQSVLTLPHVTDVRPGKHRVAVSAEGYEPYQREVDVPAGAVVPINVELRPVSGWIQVTGNRGAEVLIDGVSVGRLPSEGFPVAPGRHSVEVREAGHYTAHQMVEVGSEAPRQLQLVAEPTPRRTASWVLIGVGTAATLTGGVLGYLALQKEEEARALQDEPGTEPAFYDALDARNGLRLGAGFSAGLGAAAVLGGVISIVTEGSGPRRSEPTSSSSSALRYHASPLGACLSGVF